MFYVGDILLEYYKISDVSKMPVMYKLTAPRVAASPTKSSAAPDNFRVYSPHPFPPVLFEEAHKSSCHSTPASPPIGSFFDY